MENEHEPRLIDFSSHDRTGNWVQVRSRFAITAPAPHEFPHALAPMAFEQVNFSSLKENANSIQSEDVFLGRASSPSVANVRKNVGVPPSAHWFTWVKNMEPLFPDGGFLFRTEDKNIAGGIRVVSQTIADISQTQHHLEFRPCPNAPADLASLPNSLQDGKRWSPVTLDALRLHGGLEYAYVNPGEVSGVGASPEDSATS